MDPLEQFYDWFGDYGCFFLPVSEAEKQEHLLQVNSLASMKLALKDLYWDEENKVYGVQTLKSKRINDPMDLLPYHSEKGISYYDYYDGVPEMTNTLPLEQFLALYPGAVKLI
jgi:hypothetical protein